MSESDLETAIVELVDPGSMPIGTIVDGLDDQYSAREVQIAVIDLLDDGTLEEHPEIDDVYRVADQTVSKWA